MNLRIAAPCILALLVPACFGQVKLGSGSTSSPEAGADSGSPPNGSCTQIDVASYDTSCQVDSDCTLIATGQVCKTDCTFGCPTTLVNKDGLAQYNAATSSLTPSGPELCHCPEEPVPTCVHNKCCSDPSGCSETDASVPPDVSVPPEQDASSGDGGACIQIDAASFSSACKQTSDCLAVYTGTVCNDNCAACVPNTAISLSSEAAYEKALSALPPADPQVGCGCPTSPQPECLGGKCVFPPIPPPGG